MNNKIIINIAITFLIIWWLLMLYKFKDALIKNDNINNWTWVNIIWNSENESVELWEIKIEDEKKAKKQKIDWIKKKLALKWLILKWDINIQNWDYTSALVKYLKIYKDIPNDEATINKLWDIYYNLKKYKKSYTYYSKIKDYNKLDTNKVIKILFSSMELNEINRWLLIIELDTFKLNEEQSFYYKNSLNCLDDFSMCKDTYHKYFNAKKNQKEIVIEWTWTIEVPRFEDLYNIEKALDNYENFQIDDLLYKWALVSWAYFENWFYPIAINVSNILLEEKKDYKPLLKIVAKSHFELWNYIESKVALIKYNKLVKNDKEVSYFLWVVYERLHEYVLSNIHLKKALQIWYEDTLEVNKRILFNYYELWEIDKMLNVFKVIINEHIEKVSSEDLNLAIYYNIVNEQIADAQEYTRIALEKYPESEVFNWYMWWILMEKINKKSIKENALLWLVLNNGELIKENLYTEAEKYINKWLELNTKSPMINLVKWKLEVSKWNTRKSFIYFKKTIALDSNWDFWKMAKLELENINMDK